MSEKKYSVGEVAAMTGLTVRMLQYYDNIGLLPAVRDTESGRRYYPETSLVNLEQILFYKALGFSLNDRHIPMPIPFTSEQLQAWKMPVRVAMAANSPLHDSVKAGETAKANVTKLQIKNWPGATHSLPMEFSKEINGEILKFIEMNHYLLFTFN